MAPQIVQLWSGLVGRDSSVDRGRRRGHRRRLPRCRGCQCTHRKRVGGCMHPEEKLINSLLIGYIFPF